MNTAIMGILNVTPDSFSDGGAYMDMKDAIERAKLMEKEGANLLDIGGESSRPGAVGISVEEELRRTIPLIQELKKNNIQATLSIDTVKPEVMQQAIDSGVGFINDITALNNPKSIEAVLPYQHINLCLMHMQGTPKTMQDNPQYNDVLNDVIDFFASRIQFLKQQGIDPKRIYIDPGFGFGKSLEHNLILFKNLHHFKLLAEKLGCSGLLIGVSRKGFIGQVSGVKELKNAKKRWVGSITAALIAASRGADIVRVHDVKETQQALMTAEALAV